MRRVTLGAIFGLLVMAGNLGAAESKTQSKEEITITAMRAQKKAVVAHNMNLTAEQETIFWPMYDDYQIEINKLNGDREALIKKFAINYNNMSDDLAGELMDGEIKVENKWLDIRKNLITTFGKKFPPKVVARFFQIENKIDSVMMAEVASQIPLVK